MDEARQPGDDRRSDDLSACARAARAGADPAPEPLPASLRRRLDRCADAWLDECAVRRGVSSPPARTRSTAPWLLAAAAVLMAVVGGWPWVGEFAAGTAAAGGLGQWQAQRARERMLATAGVGHWAWGGASEAGAGDIVWDAKRQRGFLRLRSFVPNDPARARYQLWIFDAARDERYPVAGGVFDVPADRDEVVIPLHPTLPVSRAAAFAVTVEKPEGAVVPNRDKLVVFARADT